MVANYKIVELNRFSRRFEALKGEKRDIVWKKGSRTFLRAVGPQAEGFRAVAVGDVSTAEAESLLQLHRLPQELAQRVVALVGGRLSHLQEAVSYWESAPRWLSPMRPGASKDDYAASISAHFTGQSHP